MFVLFQQISQVFSKSTVLIFAMLFGFGFISMAQKALIDTDIQLSPGHKDVKDVVDEIKQNYGISFSYSDNIFDNQTMDIPSEYESSLEAFLKNYIIPLGIGYKTLGTQIVLFSADKVSGWFTVSGFVKDANTSEDIIGATVFLPDLGIGTTTNSYGFYSLKLPVGNYKIKFGCLSYLAKEIELNLNYHSQTNVMLTPKSYDVSEITIKSENSIFLESTLMNQVKIDIKSLQELPCLFGENDALRNLAVLPGIQANELSTSSINVRGGGTDQTIFLMDEAQLYSASHFGGFFSVFNPDVVNNVNVYKSDIPVKDGGALSSLIDVHLREGNNKQWQTKGGMGLISARGLVEGPLKKDQSSILIAFRRTYVDNITKILTADSDLKNAHFYFYDANLKLNYSLNQNNRIFISGYAGSDVFSQYTRMSSTNYLGSFRWNHLFGPRLFTNTTMSMSKNIMTRGTQENNELLYWQSEINNLKFKTDMSYYVSERAKFGFGYSGTIYNIYPFSLLTRTEKTLLIRYESSLDQMMLNSVYYNQQLLFFNKKLGFDAGIRATFMLTYPFTDSLVGVSDFFTEPQIRLSYVLGRNSTLKASFSQQVQPLHQLPLSMVGVAINRWMVSNKAFMPQKSMNFTLGYYNNNLFGINFSTELYYRKMDNLIETMQDLRILYTDDPQDFLYGATGESYGTEWLFSYTLNNFKGLVSYDYCKALYITPEINLGKAYEASHTRKHTLNLTGVYHFNKRISASAIWIFASGIPYTAAIGKYELNGKTYLQFDNSKINTKKLPPYHRLDVSLDIAGKKNEIHRWKSYWNFSVYNVYLRKNALGIAYFIPDQQSGIEVQNLNPGFFYLYQFVPSVSYRFEF